MARTQSKKSIRGVSTSVRSTRFIHPSVANASNLHATSRQKTTTVLGPIKHAEEVAKAKEEMKERIRGNYKLYKPISYLLIGSIAMDAESRQLLQDLHSVAGVANTQGDFDLDDPSLVVMDPMDVDDDWVDEGTNPPDAAEFVHAIRDLKLSM